MTLRADQTYSGEIVACNWMESNKGTVGLSIQIVVEEYDQIGHVYWITHKTKDRFAEDMLAFDVTAEQLKNGPFLQHDLPMLLIGRAVSFGTKLEEYKGESKIKTSWIGAKRSPKDERGTGYAVALLFAPELAQEQKPDDDDIPF
jgi:hypothetical protein